MSSTALANMKRAIDATLDGYNRLDYTTLGAPRTKDFIYQFLPLTLGVPSRSNAEYQAFFESHLKPVFSSFMITAKDIIYDVEQRKAVVYGWVDSQSVVGETRLELVMMLSFTEDGAGVKRVDEFFDSAVYSAFFARLGEMMGAAAAAAAAE